MECPYLWFNSIFDHIHLNFIGFLRDMLFRVKFLHENICELRLIRLRAFFEYLI